MDSKTIYYLYLKTHNKTGLKYLGITKQDPQIYPGSGSIWKNHIKKHGNDVNTEILGIFYDKQSLKLTSIEYSKKFNIVESKEFANLTVEEGQGGNTWDKRGRVISEKTRKKMSDSHKKLKKTKEHQEKILSKLLIHNKRKRSIEEKNKLSEGKKELDASAIIVILNRH